MGQKKQQRDERLAKALATSRAARKTEVQNMKAEWLKRGQAHYENYQKAERETVEKTRAAEANGQMYVPASPKVFLVVRIKGINKVDPKSKLILRLLRLRQINNAVFLKVNKATMNMLRRVEPYVAYGFPNRKTVEMLVYKRGYGKVSGQRVRLENNFIVQENLQKQNMVCVEDVVNELYTCGPEFRKVKPYLNGGVFGNREARINQFVRIMI